MADINYSNAVELIKAASPHVDVATKSSLDLVAKLLDLLDTLKSKNRPSNVAALGVQNQTFNLEKLLSSIRPFCSERERPLVDRFLNIFNIKKTMEMYQQYSDIFNTMQGFSGFNNNQNSNENNQYNDADEEKEPFDLDAFFRQFQSEGSNNDTQDNSSHFEFDYTGEDIAFDDDGTYDPNNLYSESNNNENMDYNFSSNNFNNNYDNDLSDDIPSQDTSDDSDDDLPDELKDFMDQINNMRKNENTEDVPDKTTPANSTQNYNQNSTQANNTTANNPAAMMNMFKNMVSPEQMGTVQNLSMLFNSMSYNDNNKKNKDNGG